MNKLVIVKKCGKCGNKKDSSNFSEDKKYKDGLNYQCKNCCNIASKKWRRRNKKHIRVYNKNWHKSNHNYHKVWYKDNAEKVKINKKKWCINNPKRVKLIWKRAKKKRLSTIKGRLNNGMSRSISEALKGNKAGRHWETLVSFTLAELIKHLETKFLPGMTWNNYGKHGWHIDHIIPIAFFIYNKPEDQEFQYCWSLDNLQPMWAKDNLTKGNKIMKV